MTDTSKMPEAVPVTEPPPEGVWMWLPIIRDPNVSNQLAGITTLLEELMAKVAVEQDDLDALDAALDEATAALAAKIDALNLPAAELQPLLDDVEALRSLSAPAPVAPPPVVEPPVEEPPA